MGTVLLDPPLKGSGEQQRRTSRHCKTDYSLPPLAYALQERIRSVLPSPPPPIAPNGGKHGMIIISIGPGAEMPEHVDPEPVPGISILRGNIIVQAAERGGVQSVCGHTLDIGVGDLHLYLVTRHRHRVSTVEGTQTRIIWLNGFCVDGDDWESGRMVLRSPNVVSAFPGNPS